MSFIRPVAIFIMGVSGVGKSTIGNLLSAQLSMPFFDGDDYHSQKSINKMAQGHPLNDDDRYEWLTNLNNVAKIQLKTNACIIACSALKETYRETLKRDIEKDVKWVLLSGSFDEILDRIKQRKGHYMPPSLLKSQFETLEIPVDALKIDIVQTPQKIAKKIVEELTDKSEFGLIGLGVMGKSLARNLASHNFKLSIFNRHVHGLEENVAIDFKNKHPELFDSIPFDDLQTFVKSLQTPRKIMLMVNAGKPVDAVIESLIPLLSKNDVIIDGGNSHYKNTQERIDLLSKHGICFIGAGVSGGEEGALNGPSIMPGGDERAYKMVKPFLETIAAKNNNGNACCDYIGKGGSGHFVKMVHNGIEYAEMQLLAETYFILKRSGKNPDEIAVVFESWMPHVASYLLEITIDILRKKENNHWLIDKVLDTSGNKGTGNWATIATAELGMPSTMIPAALFARYVSAFKEERIKISEAYFSESTQLTIETSDLLKAYQLARIVNHHQGFKLLYQASVTYNWDLNLSSIASIWTNGCIIRSLFMEALIDILKESNTILLNPSIISEIITLRPALNRVVAECVLEEIPIPCLSEAVNFLNAYKEANSSANLIQAQRDYFGAHTYQRIDDDSGTFYHTNWKHQTND
tara:strand:- start:17164 stop:19071 length:1908 start_codon:yes stop_codon:yes gene_type:complete